MNIIHYIIGDIHGQANKLAQLHGMIKARHEWKHPHQKGRLVYLGDYIDRGPDSARTIDLAIKGIDSFESIYLKGNHEAMLMDVLTWQRSSDWRFWMRAGGEPTLRSLGYDIFSDGFDIEALTSSLGELRIQWLMNLETRYQYDDFICVHAGLNPDAALSEQKEADMLWIRGKFLKSNHDFGIGVIHGHTPEDAPIIRANRIGIDTGAGMGGSLTALIIDKPWAKLIQDPVFLSAS